MLSMAFLKLLWKVNFMIKEKPRCFHFPLSLNLKAQRTLVYKLLPRTKICKRLKSVTGSRLLPCPLKWKWSNAWFYIKHYLIHSNYELLRLYWSGWISLSLNFQKETNPTESYQLLKASKQLKSLGTLNQSQYLIF